MKTIQAENNAEKSADFLKKLWVAVVERYEAFDYGTPTSKGLKHAVSKWRKLQRQPKAEFIFLYAEEVGIEYRLQAQF